MLKNTHLKWLGEAGNIQLRFDFNNVLNKVNLLGVDPNIADGSAFAQSHGAQLPRTIQLGLRIAF